MFSHFHLENIAPFGNSTPLISDSVFVHRHVSKLTHQHSKEDMILFWLLSLWIEYFFLPMQYRISKAQSNMHMHMHTHPKLELSLSLNQALSIIMLLCSVYCLFLLIARSLFSSSCFSQIHKYIHIFVLNNIVHMGTIYSIFFYLVDRIGVINHSPVYQDFWVSCWFVYFIMCRAVSFTNQSHMIAWPIQDTAIRTHAEQSVFVGSLI